MFTSAERQKVKCPVLPGARGLALIPDVLQGSLLGPVELQAYLAGVAFKAGWILDQLVLDNFLLKFVLGETLPGVVLASLLDVENAGIFGHNNHEHSISVLAKVSVPALLIIGKVTVTNRAKLKTFNRVDIGGDRGLEVRAWRCR